MERSAAFTPFWCSGLGKYGTDHRNLFRGVALAQVKNRVFWALFCHFGHVLAILGILAEITVRYWLSTDFKSANKSEHTPYGVASEVIKWLYFARSVSLRSKKSH